MRLSHLGRHVLVVVFLLALGPATNAQVGRVLSDAPGNAATADGSTPLHQAVRQNDLKTVDTLIKSGANVKAVDEIWRHADARGRDQRERGDPAPAAERRR